MFKTFSIFLLFFYLISNTAYSEIIDNVVINGNQRISKETIKVLGKINQKKYTIKVKLIFY